MSPWLRLLRGIIVEKEIGRGGMAVVFRAHDERHDRTVALKMVHPEIGDSLVHPRLHGESAEQRAVRSCDKNLIVALHIIRAYDLSHSDSAVAF